MRILLFFLAAAPLVFPQAKAQKAHVHGAAEIRIAMDGLKGEIEFEAPAEGIVGFESAPKTPAQKKIVEDALTRLRERGGELVQLPAASACKLIPKEVDLHSEGQHADVHAHYDVSCVKALSGEIRFGVTRLFPRTAEVSVTLINGDAQKSARIVADRGSLRP